MPLLCILRFRKTFSDIMGVDEWPCEIISSSDGFEPHGFCQKICHCMKVYDGWFISWEFIDVVDSFLVGCQY